MTTINNIGDLVRILQEQPEWVEALRSILLTREMIELPERLAQFMEATAEGFQAVNSRLDLLEGDLAEFKSEVRQRFDGVDQRFDGIDHRLNQMNGRMDNGFGVNYEMKAERCISSVAGQFLNMRRVRVHREVFQGNDPDLAEQIEQAVDDGLISWEQRNSLMAADIIFTGRDRENGATVHAVAEASITAGNDDVIRAFERAGILAAVTGEPALAVVISSAMPQEQQQMAEQMGVTAIHMPW